MNEEQILRQLNFSEELMDIIRNAPKIDSYEDVPEVIEMETEDENLISRSSFIYSSY